MIFAVLALAFSREGPTVHTATEWREDLAHMVEQVQSKHPLPWQYGASEKEFLADFAKLDKQIPAMNDGRILLEIFRVFGSIDDSHSEPYWNTVPEDILPMNIVGVRFRHFSDGVFVTQALAGQRSLLGAELLAIEAQPIDEILSKAMEYQSGDNPIRRRTVAVEIALPRPGVLNALDLCQSPGSATYTFRLADGTIKPITLKVFDGPSFEASGVTNEASLNLRHGKWSTRKWTHANDQSTLPLYQQERGRRYWFEYLAESKIMYVRFARVIDDPAESFDDFTDRLFASIASSDVKKLVIDMRRNKGGYGNMGLKLVDKISKHELGKKGNLFVILGRGTKSAAPVFALRLERAASPTFIGEPSGGRPTSFGNTSPTTLPNSRAQFRTATAVLKLTSEEDPRKTFTPDVLVEISSSDYFGNVDVVIARIMNIK